MFKNYVHINTNQNLGDLKLGNKINEDYYSDEEIKRMIKEGRIIPTTAMSEDYNTTLGEREKESLRQKSKKKVIEILKKESFDEKFDRIIGKIDLEKLKRETELYGAKGANLEILRKIKDGLESITFELHDSICVPDFKRIGTHIYRKWKSGDYIDNDLKQFFKWIKGKNILIRSSAVYSEDGEKATGAGIYESVFFSGNGTFKEFKEKVIEVYESTESDRAKKYRLDNGIEQEEKMGIVLQEFINSDEVNKGYVNTSIEYEGLMLINMDDGYEKVEKKNFYTDLFNIENLSIINKEFNFPGLKNISKSELNHFILSYYIKPLVKKINKLRYIDTEHYNQEQSTFYYFRPKNHNDFSKVLALNYLKKRYFEGKIDNNKDLWDLYKYDFADADYDFIEELKKINDFSKIGALSYLLEKYYGKPLQLEFIDICDKIVLLQSRLLPKNSSKEEDFEYPKNKNSIIGGTCYEKVNKTLNILPNNQNNNNNIGIVFLPKGIISNNYTINIGKLIPKEGVVIVSGKPIGFRGHVETLIRERGLKIFYINQTIPLSIFDGYKKLHLVSNGLIGRIYPPDEEK